MNKEKQRDLLILILAIPVLGTIFYLLNVNFLVASLIFYGIPSLYLSYKAKEHVLRTSIFAIILGFFGGFVADYLFTLNGVWFVQSAEMPRLLGIVPIEDLVWSVLLVYYITIFYEYFFDRNKSYVENRLHNIFMYGYIITTIILVFFGFSIELFAKLPNPYLLFGIPILTIIPLLFVLKNPRYLGRFVPVSVFFFFHSLLFEIISVKLNYWVFESGNYIGWFSFLEVGFPFEEFLFYPVLFAFATLCAYELFFDYRRK